MVVSTLVAGLVLHITCHVIFWRLAFDRILRCRWRLGFHGIGPTRRSLTAMVRDSSCVMPNDDYLLMASDGYIKKEIAE